MFLQYTNLLTNDQISCKKIFNFQLYGFSNNELILASQNKRIILINTSVIVNKIRDQFDFASINKKNIAFTQDGKKLLFFQNNDKYSLINLNNSQILLQKDTLNQRQIFSLDPKSNILVLQDLNCKKKIFLYNFELDQEITSLEYKSIISSIAISSDGKLLASGHIDYTIIVQNLQTSSQLQIFQGHKEEIQIIQFSTDNKILISADKNKIIKVWDISTGSVISIPGRYYTTFQLSPNSKLLAKGQKNELLIWDVQNGQKYKQVQHFENDFYLLKKIIFLDDNLILTHYGQIFIWNLEKESIIKKITNSNIASLDFSLQSQSLAVLSSNSIYLYKPYLKMEQLLLYQHQSLVKSISSFHKEKQLISCDLNGGFKIFNSQFHAFLQEPDIQSIPLCISLSATDNLLACGCQDSLIILWDITTSTLMKKFQSYQNQINAIEFSKNEQFLVSASEDGTIVVWDLPTGKQNKILCKNCSPIIQVVFSVDDQQIISCHQDNTIHFWNIWKRNCEQCFYQHQNQIFSMALSPDGKNLAFGCENNKIHLLDVDNRNLTQELDFNDGCKVNVVAFSKDGKFLASGNDDESVHLIQLNNRRLVGKLFNTGKVTCLAFSNDHLTLIYGNEKGKVYKVAWGEINLRLIKIYSNELQFLYQNNTSFKNAHIISNDGNDLTSVYLNCLQP